MSVSLDLQEDGSWETIRSNNDIVARNLRVPMPNARVFHSTTQSIPDNITTTLTFNSERWDVGNMHDNAVNPSRLRAPITGTYTIGANIAFAFSAAGYREVNLVVNGTTRIARDRRMSTTVAGTMADTCIMTEYHLNAGDYVEVSVVQNSGAALNVQNTPNSSPEFWMRRVGGFTNEGIA